MWIMCGLCVNKKRTGMQKIRLHPAHRFPFLSSSVNPPAGLTLPLLQPSVIPPHLWHPDTGLVPLLGLLHPLLLQLGELPCLQHLEKGTATSGEGAS